MSKQTFTTGQVLTASQLTNLQQTAMLGGDAVTKTANYVLVAADAGSTVAMTSTSATTVTVNTGLFAAGDTVFIQNRGSGNLTVTAGTATVATAGSLILPQNDAGILYFTATGASIFYDFIQVGAASPLTTKGDLYTFSTSDTRLAVSPTNGHTLVADSSEATGLKWQAPAGGGGMTVIASGAFTATATLDLTDISGSYKNLQFVARNINPNGDRTLRARFNGLTTSIYNAITITNINGAAATAAYAAEDKFVLTAATAQSPLGGPLIIDIFDYANTTSFKTITVQLNHLNNGGQVSQMFLSGTIRTNNALNQLTLSLSAGDFVAGGTYTLYGVN